MKQFFGAFEKAQKQAAHRGKYRALLGDGEGNVFVYDASDEPILGYAWVRINFGNGQAVRVVRCRKVSPENDFPVWVGPGIDDELEVLEEDPGAAIQLTGGRGLGPGAHAWTHAVFGTDMLVLDPRLYQPGMVTPTSPASMSIQVEGFHYAYGTEYRYYAGETIDMETYIPAAETQQLFVIGFNRYLGQAVVITDPNTYYLGGEAVENILEYTFSKNAIAGINTGTYDRLSVIRLYFGQTQIGWIDIADALGPGIATLDQVSPVDRMLTDDNGNILVDNNGNPLESDW